MRKLVFASLLLAASLACSDPSGISLEATGVVAGQAFFDRDGDGRRDPNDPFVAGVVAAVLLEATGDTVAQSTTATDGTFEISAVPVGRYRLVARRGALLGDTVEVVQIDSAHIMVTPGDTIRRVIRLSYPLVRVSAASALPAGRRVVIEGIALNSWSSFGDSTVHVHDGTGALRAVRTQPSGLQAGDSIRLLGTIGVVGGVVSLVDAAPQIIGVARGLPPAVTLSTGAAATADGGRHAAARIRIVGATVRDTATVGGFRRVGVDDGTGRLELLLNRALPFVTEAFLPGAIVEAAGVLAPASAGPLWQLRPHDPADVAADFTTVTAAEARTLPSGQRVYVNGIALNAWSTFGDSTLHVADASGAIRAVRVQFAPVGAGDSVQVLGTTGRVEGRPALLDATARVVAFGRGLPPLDSVGSAAAAHAGGGTRANGQVRIAGALIQDTVTLAGDLVLGVNDGSGRLEVVLDRDVAFNPEPYVPGATFHGAGVLVPAPQDTAAWRLKPRERSEAAITFATTTVASARGLAVGAPVVIEGVALNAWSAFGDSTVHVADGTGAIRAVRVQESAIAAGDGIRLIGVIGTRAGQPVVTLATASVLLRGVGHAPPHPLVTAVAADAAGGVLDAALVRISGTIVGMQALGAGSLLAVDDGSGPAQVVLDAAVTAGTANLAPGAELAATGVLVPSGAGTWQLKPRTGADVTATHPTVTIAEARALTAGRHAHIEGIALNGWITFGDSTVHMSDASGTIRVVRLPPSPIFAGDSVRILGTASVRNGQPVLVGVSAAVLRSGARTPFAVSLFTGAAATAQGGLRDAGLVTVTGLVADPISVTAGGDVLLPVDDGSGPVTVVLDRDVGFATGGYQAGMFVRVTGLLVPSEDRLRWELKPRSLEDFTVLSGAPAPVGPDASRSAIIGPDAPRESGAASRPATSDAGRR